MKYIFGIFFLSGCMCSDISYKYVEQAKDVCIKNDGVDYFRTRGFLLGVIGTPDNIKVYCKNGVSKSLEQK